MNATWDDDSKSESDDEVQKEVANMCFMAIDDEAKSLELNGESSNDEFDDKFEDFSYEELVNDFNDLHRNQEKLIFKNGPLKIKFSSLSKELEDFSKEKEVILTCDLFD